MKYLIRSVKYFIYICVFVSIILLAMVLLGFVSSDINVMFQQGWKSVGYIALMFAAVAVIYPAFGFKKRLAGVLGDFADLRPGAISYMEEHGYVLESENDQVMTFRYRSFINRLFRMFEDRITLGKTLGGFEVEGLTRDVYRIVYGLEYKLRQPDA